VAENLILAASIEMAKLATVAAMPKAARRTAVAVALAEGLFSAAQQTTVDIATVGKTLALWKPSAAMVFASAARPVTTAIKVLAMDVRQTALPLKRATYALRLARHVFPHRYVTTRKSPAQRTVTMAITFQTTAARQLVELKRVGLAHAWARLVLQRNAVTAWLWAQRPVMTVKLSRKTTTVVLLNASSNLLCRLTPTPGCAPSLENPVCERTVATA
jgi:hypothetical protein